MIRRARALAFLGGWMILLIGILLQLGLRDGWQPIAVVFYALPLPALIAAALVLSTPVLRRGRLQIAAALITVGLATLWISRSWCWNPPPPPPDPDELRVLYWNLSRPETPLAELVSLMTARQPDIAAFVEPGRVDAAHLAFYRSQLPDYTIEFMPRGILWMTRLPQNMRGRGKLDQIGAFAKWDVTWQAQTVRVIAVDVYAHPLTPRGQQLTETHAHLDQHHHAIVMGDFNTPLESIHYAPYRADLIHAFEAGGRGFRETWFWGMPLFSLDHIWVTPTFEVIHTEKLHEPFSDHEGLFCRLRLR